MGTLLELCRDVARRQGLGSLPGGVVSDTSGTALRLFGLATETAVALASRFDWQQLRVETTFLTVAQEEQTNGTVPTDFDHFVNETVWNRTAHWMLIGPLTPQEYQAQKSGVAAVVNHAFTIRGNAFLMLSAPPAGQTIAYEYVSQWAIAVTATPTVKAKSAFTLDTDVWLLDDEMFKLDLLWRYRHSRGLNYAESFRSAELRILDRIAKNGGRRTLDLTRGSPGRNDPRRPNIPEGSWNL